MFTIGTHNTLDGKAPATPFASVIFFTEAIPARVRTQISATHSVYVCRRQPDLIIAVSRELGWELVPHYKKAHWGVRKVTPNRGTYWLTSDKHRVALVVEHRINAAFAPFKRGEGLFRKTMWEIHTRMTLRIIRRLIRQGYDVHAGGDLNAPRGVSGYRGVLNERGSHYDRLGSTRPMGPVKVLSRLGSDHWRYKAKVG
jgi:hypothetical protein